MQAAARICAQADNVTGIWRNLGLKEYDVEHVGQCIAPAGRQHAAHTSGGAFLYRVLEVK
jgi:hypothetical protein